MKILVLPKPREGVPREKLLLLMPLLSLSWCYLLFDAYNLIEENVFF